MTLSFRYGLAFRGIVASLLASCAGAGNENVGSTEITKWQDGKTGAISITFDDGSPNQFRNALPILNRLGIDATFFIVTVRQAERIEDIQARTDETGSFVIYRATPNAEPIVLSPTSSLDSG